MIIRDSKIYENARIKGLAQIYNSEICQSSSIEGIKLNNSNYYCQTEDSQPKDPGTIGEISLLGVDSDGDGVRDDVEIFINNKLSNSNQKNMKTQRVVSKLIASINQKEMVTTNNETLIRLLNQAKLNLIRCFAPLIADEVLIVMINTEMRLKAYINNIGVLHGEEFPVLDQKCDTLDNYVTKVSKIVRTK